MMKKAKKIICMCLLLILGTVAVSQNVSAATVNNMIWSENTVETEVKITKTMNYVHYSGNVSGDTGSVILQFTETTTGLSYTKTFVCDGNWYTQSRPLPVGTYKVTMKLNQCPDLEMLTINFWQTSNGL